MTTFEVVDPETGEHIYLARIERDGQVFYQRLKRSIHDPGSVTPREQLARDALTTAASTAFGQRNRSDEPAAWGPVRKDVPEVMRRFPTPKNSKRQMTQARYRELVNPEPPKLAPGPRVEHGPDGYVLYVERSITLLRHRKLDGATG